MIVSSRADRRQLAVSLVGNDARLIGQILDRVSHFVRMDAEVMAQGVDVDVSRWHAPTGRWLQEDDDG